MEKYILFGAGAYAKDAIRLLGKEHIECIYDNNSNKWGTEIEGIPVRALLCKRDKLAERQIIISVSWRYQEEIISQLKKLGISNYRTIQDMQMEIIRKKLGRRTNYIDIFQRAINWIKHNCVDSEAIICNTDKRIGYPEVTGYYIPTLLKWGYRELAVCYAGWLCRIQKPDGSWYDTEDREHYVFDSAQVLKGLIAIREVWPEVDKHIRKGCDWILTNIQEDGRLTTSSKDAWGNPGVCSELVHLYCLSPLIEAAEKLGKPEYKEAALKVLNYYKENHYEEIMNFGFLSHFYAYVMEALLDMGETEMARQAMEKVAQLQKESGAVPAYHDVDWVCSTGLFQFALVWFRLGEIDRGNRAFEYACKLQNESGGWYGSYLSEDSKEEDNDYFPTAEISWAVKYFLDALYYKNLAEFNLWADSFLPIIDKEDGRYQIIKNGILELGGQNSELSICDVGCGKGRYLKNLMEDMPENRYCGVDLSESVLQYIEDERIAKKQGSLTRIPYEDNTFDMVYTCEALEHAVDICSAVREMARVTKPGGKIIVIDKNKEALGRLEIAEWEVWFDLEELENIMREFCHAVDAVRDIPYEGKMGDNLFAAWIGIVK
jgi:malonyl-CoA O-methyltransferase